MSGYPADTQVRLYRAATIPVRRYSGDPWVGYTVGCTGVGASGVVRPATVVRLTTERRAACVVILQASGRTPAITVDRSRGNSWGME